MIHTVKPIIKLEFHVLHETLEKYTFKEIETTLLNLFTVLLSLCHFPQPLSWSLRMKPEDRITGVRKAMASRLPRP